MGKIEEVNKINTFSETKKREMVEALGYMENGCFVTKNVNKKWVAKLNNALIDDSLKSDFPDGSPFNCVNKEFEIFDFITNETIRELYKLRFINYEIKDSLNANHIQILICLPLKKGKDWYLGERDKYAKSLRHSFEQ